MSFPQSFNVSQPCKVLNSINETKRNEVKTVLTLAQMHWIVNNTPPLFYFLQKVPVTNHRPLARATKPVSD